MTLTNNNAHAPAPLSMPETDLHDYRARLLLSEILGIMSESRPLGETLEAIAETVCIRMNFQSCAIMLEQPGSDRLIIEGAFGVAPGYIEAVNHSYPIYIRDPELSGGPSSEALRTMQPVLIEDTNTDLRMHPWRTLTTEYGIGSFVTVPLCARGEPIGAMNCYRRLPGRFDENEVAALTSVATQSGIAIDIARMVEAQHVSIERLQELTDALEEKHQLLERAAEIQDALTELVLTNQGISAIAAILARVTGGPTVVQDQFFQVLAASDGTAQQVAPDIIARTSVDEDSVRRRRFGTRTPVEIPAGSGSVPGSPRIVAPVLAGTDLFGYVSIAVPAHPAPEFVRRVLEHAATVIALETIKDRLAHDSELRVRRGFADDLLAGRFDYPEQMRERGRFLGYDLRGSFQAVVFEIDRLDDHIESKNLGVAEIDAIGLQFFDAVQSVAASRMPHTLVGGRHDRLGMILAGIHEENAAEIIDPMIERVRCASGRSLSGLSISVGVGRVYPNLSDVPTSDAEASRALHVIRKLGGQSKSVRFADLGVLRLLFQVEDSSELIDFAQTRLAPILAYDAEHEGILLHTLAAYLAAGQSVNRTAEQVAVHPNTVRYRLLKAEELLGVSLKDTAVLLDLQLSCFILKIVDTAAPSGHIDW